MTDIPRIIALIPARYHSKRFPGKLLQEIRGRSVLAHIWNTVSTLSDIDESAIVVDGKELYEEGNRIGANVLLSSEDYSCGTDRCIGALQAFGKFDWMINVQADQPFLSPEALRDFVHYLRKSEDILIASMMSVDVCRDASPDTVKVSIDQYGNARSFSRDLPPEGDFYRHIGVYAFSSKAVELLRNLSPTSNEKLHSLEQLRWMDHNLPIRMFGVNDNSSSVDRPADIDKLKFSNDH